MSRANADYEFVTTDASQIEEDIAAMYTAITGRTATAGPDRLFIQWVASVILLANANINRAGNANLPSRAEGDDLDALAQLFYVQTRPPATAAGVLMKFTISAAQSSAVLIPAGTRVTNREGDIVFATDEDAYVAIGDLDVTVHATCEETGSSGNGYAAGTITTCVDPFAYYASCTNTDESDGGSDVPDDDAFYETLVASQDAYSSAGPIGAYQYFAKSVSTDIADVLVNSPAAGYVYIYALMKDGTPAGTEIKNAILAACNDDEIRPLTDNVVVSDPDTVSYNVTLTYYTTEGNGNSAASIAAAVQDAVNEYIAWQDGKMGRDINPSKLIQMVMATGVKRVAVTSPSYTVLKDGTADVGDPLADWVPQLAQIGTVTITNGGAEHE